LGLLAPKEIAAFAVDGAVAPDRDRASERIRTSNKKSVPSRRGTGGLFAGWTSKEAQMDDDRHGVVEG
jgi:hypothetical protein